MMIIRVALFFFSCIHAILCLRCFPSPRVVAATRHSTRLFKRVYHNDDGSFDVDSAPKLSFNENFYRVLEVDSNCSQKDLKKSFLKMIFTYHPDRISRDDPDFEELKALRTQQTMVINSAYKSLKDDEVRFEYDKRNREPIRMSSSAAGGFGKKKDNPSPTATAAAVSTTDGDGIKRVVQVEKGKKGKKNSRVTVKEDTAI